MVFGFLRTVYFQIHFQNKQKIEKTNYCWFFLCGVKKEFAFCHKVFSEYFLITLFSSNIHFFIWPFETGDIASFSFKQILLLKFSLCWNIQITELVACCYTSGICWICMSLSNTLRKAIISVVFIQTLQLFHLLLNKRI